MPDETKIKVELSTIELSNMVRTRMERIVDTSLESERINIQNLIKKYFESRSWVDKTSFFDSAMDYALENAFRVALDKAMKELNYDNLIYEKMVELLKDSNLLEEIARKKIDSMFGLDRKK